MAQNVRSKGWVGRVTHPDTSRILRAKALSDPRIEPSINTLPRIHLPVPRSQQWQDLNFTTEPTFEVFLDGAKQPIDELTNIRDRREQNASVLVGRGGVELLEQASVEFGSSRRHLAAQQVIQNQTTYDDDIDTPNSDVLEDQDQQDPTTQAELAALITFADTDPLEAAGGGIQTQQTCWTTEAEDYDRSTNFTASNDITGFNELSDGDGIRFLSVGEIAEWDFTTSHVIPEDNVTLKIREGVNDVSGRNRVGVEFSIDGTVFFTIPDNTGISIVEWRGIGDQGITGGWSNGDLAAGNHTLKAECISAAGQQTNIDVVAPHDDRYNYTFDNTVHQNQGYLDGPETKPDAVEAEFDAATTAFQMIAGTVTIAIDDDTGTGGAPSGSQKVQLRNLPNGTYKPDDGTEDNTESATVDPFASAGDRLQLNVTLSRWSASGTRNQTPREGYSSQTLTSYDLDGDIREESLILDYRRNASIEEILTDIAGDEFFWSYRIVNGTKTVTFTQPGQRTGGTEPQLIKADIDQDVETIHEVEVQGSNKTVSGEQFSASTSFVNLTETDIVPASESVRDPDTGDQFVRSEDYEMDWSDGQIRITDDGDMVASDTYEITYRAEVSGTHTATDAPASPRTLTVDIPGVTSSRNAEQLAFVLVSDLKDPRWIGDVVIPPSVTDFDVVEALPLDKLGLPSGASPFFIPEPPRQTPRGTEFRLESQPDQQRRVAQLKRQVSAVVRRTG